MELLQLLKTLGDQSSQADIQEQISQLSVAMVDYVKFSTGVQIFLAFLILTFFIIHEISLYKLNKRIKKIEVAGGLEKS